MNNKGFTLMELLVTIGISSVVVLMLSFMLVQGTQLFKGQTESIDLQNELQIVRNQMNEAMMSAKEIIIVEAGDDLVIYTGEVNTSSNKLVAETAGASGGSAVTTERVITYDKSEGKLYISNNYEQSTAEGNLVSSYITELDIEINKDCMKTVEDGEVSETYYVNPLSVDIKMTVSNGEKEADGHISVKVRNVLQQVALYKTDVRGTLLINVTDVSTFKVK